MLENHGISAIVTGDYLQGGLGELPAFGMIEVRVDDEEADEARRIVQRFETGDEPDGELET